MKTLMWSTPIPYNQLENVKLPFSFSFVTDFVDDVLCVVGLTSTNVSISWDELKMVNEGFSF